MTNEHNNPPAVYQVALPKDAKEIREFIGSECISMEFANAKESGDWKEFFNTEPSDDDKYYVTAHDLLSAFSLWASCNPHAATQTAHEAKAAPAVPQGDTVEIIGMRGGKEHHLGTMRMPPRMKAREIAREQFGHFVDDDGSDAELCFGALEQLIDYMQATPAEPSQPVTLTDEVLEPIVKVIFDSGWSACRDSELVGDNAKEFAWDMSGDEITERLIATLREKGVK